VVVGVGVDLADVQLEPPSQGRWTHSFGDPDVLSALASSRTWMPLIFEPLGIEKP
jgi:hypothetical protein